MRQFLCCGDKAWEGGRGGRTDGRLLFGDNFKGKKDTNESDWIEMSTNQRRAGNKNRETFFFQSYKRRRFFQKKIPEWFLMTFLQLELKDCQPQGLNLTITFRLIQPPCLSNGMIWLE